MDYSSKLEYEHSLLRGNIHRMYLTADEEKLICMRNWARLRIENLFKLLQSQMQERRRADNEQNPPTVPHL